MAEPDFGLVDGNLARHLWGGPRRRRKPALPLPLHQHQSAGDSSWNVSEVPIGRALLEDCTEFLFASLHSIHQNIQSWNSLKRGSRAKCYYFMVFQRGPKSLTKETWKSFNRMIRFTSSPPSSLLGSAELMMSTNVTSLRVMQSCLCTILSKIFHDAASSRDTLNGSMEESLNAAFIILNRCFNAFATSAEENFQEEVAFNHLPRIHNGSSNSRNYALNGINLLYENMRRLDRVISSHGDKYNMPAKIARNWVPYTVGAIGLSACSLWLFKNMEAADFQNFMKASQNTISRLWFDKSAKTCSHNTG